MGGFNDIVGNVLGKYNDEIRKAASAKVDAGEKAGVQDKLKDASEIYLTGEKTGSGQNTKDTPLGNWYKQKPYAFEFGDSKDRRTFYLPISPSNLNITTHFATNVISTMYGTVEEHSEQRYYDISISGTTGMSPRYYKEIKTQIRDHKNEVDGRAGVPVKSKVQASGLLGGFFKRTLSLVDNVLNQASDLLGDDEPSTGIDLEKTGYAAFHNFYKFLLVHKKFAAGEKVRHKSTSKTLRFINYKDNNMYDVAVQTFQLTRDASNPMLYNYNIVMRAYNMRSADKKDISADVKERSEELGLSGIETTSVFAKVANKARQAKNAGYSAIAAARGFGS